MASTTLFSGLNHAKIYAKFRPSPPESLIKCIIQYVTSKINTPLETAVDIGCGTGQSTQCLSPHFKKVYGFDVSEAQIQLAKESFPAKNVEYNVSEGETWPSLPSSSVDLVTFSQSVHWFNLNEVFNEVKRILKPNGVVALYAYSIPTPKTNIPDKDKAIDELVNKYLYIDQLGKYWPKVRSLVDNRYADIKLPFKDIQKFEFADTTTSSISDYICYFSSWSPYQLLFKEDSKKAEALLLEVQNRLSDIIQSGKSPEETTLTLYADFFMHIGCK